jgi:hypothetical protein
MTETLAWKSIGRRPEWKSDMIRADDPQGGEWTVYPDHDRRSRIVDFKYRAPPPEGETWLSWQQKLTARDIQFDDPQDHVDWASISGQDSGRAFNQAQAKLVVERLLAGSEGLPDARTILLDGGFRLYADVHYERWPDVKLQSDYPNWYEFDVGKGGISITLSDAPEVGLVCRYEPKRSNHSWPLLVVQGDRYDHNKTKVIPAVWPKGCDPIRVAAKFVVDELVPWVKNNRMDRL